MTALLAGVLSICSPAILNNAEALAQARKPGIHLTIEQAEMLRQNVNSWLGFRFSQFEFPEFLAFAEKMAPGVLGINATSSGKEQLNMTIYYDIAQNMGDAKQRIHIKDMTRNSFNAFWHAGVKNEGDLKRLLSYLDRSSYFKGRNISKWWEANTTVTRKDSAAADLQEKREKAAKPKPKQIVQLQNKEAETLSPLIDCVPHYSASDSSAAWGLGADIGRKLGMDIKEPEFVEFASRMSSLLGNRGCYTYHFFIVTESDYQKMGPQEIFQMKLNTRENMLGWFGTKDDEQALLRILDEMDKSPVFQGKNFGSWWRTNVSFNGQDRQFLEQDAKERAIGQKKYEERMQATGDRQKKREFAKKVGEFAEKYHLIDASNLLQKTGMSRMTAEGVVSIGVLLGIFVAAPLLTWKSIRFIVRKVGDAMRNSKAEKLKAEMKKAAELAKGVIDIDKVLPAFEKAEKEMIAFRQETIKKFGEKEGWERIEKMGIGHITHDEYDLTITMDDAFFLSMCTICLVNVREKLRNVNTREEFSECTTANGKIYACAEERGKRAGNPNMVVPLKAYRLGYQSAWQDAMRRIMGDKDMKFWKSYRA